MQILKKVFQSYKPTILKFKKEGIATLILYGTATLLSWVFNPLILKWIIDEVSNPALESADNLYKLFILLLFNGLAEQIAYRTGDFFIVKGQTRALKELFDSTLQHLLKHSYSFFGENFTGSLVAKVNRYVNGFETIWDSIVFSFWMDGIKVIAMSIVLLQINPYISLAFLVWCAIFVVISVAIINWRLKFDLKQSQTNSKVNARIADNIGNAIAIQTFAKEAQEMENFSKLSHQLQKDNYQAWSAQNIQFLIQGFAVFLLEIGMMYTAIQMWLAGSLSAGVIVLLQSYIYIIGRSLWDLGRTISRFNKSLADAYEMVEIINLKPDIADQPNARSLEVTKGKIDFKNINFAYKDDSEAVLENFNLSINSKEKIGLVGLSGAGKSTITKLLLRFLEKNSGNIKIDDQEIQTATLSSLRQKISYVPQEPVLFHRTLRENIAYAKPNIETNELNQIIEAAHLSELIKSLPKQLETFVGERGVKLSGGERQRVAIARAMVENSPILVLDEATSALDSESEHFIQESLAKLIQNKTAIVIAHRLSTLKLMDRIVVLDQGKIIESGNHQQLLNNNGTYAKLWQHQSGAFLK